MSWEILRHRLRGRSFTSDHVTTMNARGCAIDRLVHEKAPPLRFSPRGCASNVRSSVGLTPDPEDGTFSFASFDLLT